MVKKLKKSTKDKGAKVLDSDLANSVKDSAQQIWLAGMGAFAKAQKEGAKVFDSLVKEGSNLQRKTQGIAEERLSAVSGKVSAMAEGMSSKAGAQWDKLETIFETRIAKALHKMGVPQNEDVEALKRRIDELSAQVAGKKTTAGKKAAAPRKTSAAPGKTPPARKTSAPAAKRSPRAKSNGA